MAVLTLPFPFPAKQLLPVAKREDLIWLSVLGMIFLDLLVPPCVMFPLQSAALLRRGPRDRWLDLG